MAFTGTAVVEKINDRLCRITGLSLAATASGTIGLSGHATADVKLPADFLPTNQADATQAEAIEISYVPVSAVTAFPPIQVVKADGPFLATLTNGHGTVASGDLEIYVRFH